MDPTPVLPPEELAIVGALLVYGELSTTELAKACQTDIRPILRLWHRGFVRIYWVDRWNRKKRKMMVQLA